MVWDADAAAVMLGLLQRGTVTFAVSERFACEDHDVFSFGSIVCVPTAVWPQHFRE
jgi:hypothetical protein